jgi:hypothetical protein
MSSKRSAPLGLKGGGGVNGLDARDGESRGFENGDVDVGVKCEDGDVVELSKCKTGRTSQVEGLLQDSTSSIASTKAVKDLSERMPSKE